MKYCLNIQVISSWLLVIGFFCLFPTPLFAQGDIASSQEVLYTVFENGTTRVSHKIHLTNLTTTKYAAEYSLFVGFVDVAHVTAADSQGTMRVDVTTQQKGTDMHVFFNEPVVGKGNVLSFTLSYETNEIATQHGNVWEIIIPRIKDSPDLTDFTATLSVPTSYGEPSFIKPTSVQGLIFSKEDILQGISVVFGEYQLFDYTLSYHVRNSRLYPVITEIALPPDTAYQEVVLNELSPKPLTVVLDPDGNWLALYRLEGSQKIDITAKGTAKLHYAPVNRDLSPNTDLASYLVPKNYWEIADPGVAQKAKELKTARAIYDFVVKTLNYDFARIEKSLPRAGAAEALSNPQSATCIEFTDLFIAMARAAGIPAREIDGFAYTENTRLRPLSLVKDILHAWPEYYDEEKNLWIAVDPTWSNTSGIDYFDTFDFNHFAFVIKGQDSEYPHPAGSYKENDQEVEKKDIEISFAQDDTFDKKTGVTIATDIATTQAAGFFIRGNILVSNAGNALYTGGELTVSSEKLTPQNQKLTVGAIPPFGNRMIPVTLQSLNYIDSFKTTIHARLDGQEFTYDFQILPLYLVYLPWILGGITLGIIFIATRTTWHLYLQRQKGARALRGESKESQGSSSKLPS